MILIEDTLSALGRVIVQLIKWIIIDAIIEGVVYGYGYLSLKLITLGKYPKANQHNDILCIISGVISIAVTISIIVLFSS
jgi:hypothetical protein